MLEEEEVVVVTVGMLGWNAETATSQKSWIDMIENDKKNMETDINEKLECREGDVPELMD